MSNMAAGVAQGMALGTGSALAHRAVDSVLGSRHPEPAAATEAAQVGLPASASSAAPAGRGNLAASTANLYLSNEQVFCSQMCQSSHHG
jgi:hypothetical protein